MDSSLFKTSASRRTLVFGICVFLAAIVWLAFGRTLGFGFVNYDDPRTVSEVAEITRGLSAEGIGWAFTHTVIGHWDPLTTLSHMVDCQIYGLKPWGHHLTNVLLHAAGTILLFLALREMTGALWRSAFVAALFAIHPLRVESVAWITERKDVLSGVFFMLALGAYARYAHGPSARRYFSVALAFALGLLCKSMLVTLPFVLLLLDYWPLGRWADRRAFPWPLLIEKIPLLLLSAASAAIQIFAARDMMTPIQTLSLSARLESTLVAYAAYLGKIVWPVKLAVFYPSPGVWPAAQVLPAAAVLLGLSILAVVSRREHPYVLVGWLWFLGMLVPVAGLLQVGDQAMADRYSYLPSIGVFIALAWGARDITRCWSHPLLTRGAAAAAILICCAMITRRQCEYWKDSQSLFRHALASTQRNPVAHLNLGMALLRTPGGLPEATAEFEAALRIKPDDPIIHNDLGIADQSAGDLPKAISEFQTALRLAPDDPERHFNLANALATIPDRVPEAISEYEAALRIDPDFAEAQTNVGNILVKIPGRLPEAIAHFEAAARIDPHLAEPHYDLGNAYLKTQDGLPEAVSEYQAAVEIDPDYFQAQTNLGAALWKLPGRSQEAIAHLEEALRINPRYAEAHYNLGLILVNAPGRIPEGVAHFEAALQINPDYWEAHNNLGVALADMPGRLPEAITHFEAALRINPSSVQARSNLAMARQLMEQSRTGKP